MSRECKSQSANFLMRRPVAGVDGVDWSRVANDHAALVGGRCRRVVLTLLRSDDTDESSGVASGPLAAKSAFMLPHLVRF
jgi:hypothetical protein